MMECNRCHTPLPDYAKFCLTCGLDVSGNPVGHTLAETDPALLKKLQDDLGDDFLVERELGRGGMAIVYLARDVHIGRKVAVKVLPPELSFSHGAGFVDRFKREARTAGSLEHPHIIPIHRVSTEGKLFWYIMKYVEGESLDLVIKREGQLPMRKTADILNATADALDYAHKRGVIHRDIKPGNVLIDAEGKVTITDFGIAKAFLGESLTVSGSILGTPYYMSPEQCAGKQLTGAADQYSLAVMAYQMLAGHLPFQGESAVEIIKKHTLDPPPPLQVLRPGVPGPASAAIERALAKDPKDRFPTAKDFVRAFEKPSEESTSPMSLDDTEIAKRATEKLAKLPDVIMPTQATPLPRFLNSSVMEWVYAVQSRLSPVRAFMRRAVQNLTPLVARLEPLRARLAPVRARLAPVLNPVANVWRGLDTRVQAFTGVAIVVSLIVAAVPSRAARQARADSIAADSAATVAAAVAAAARRDSIAAAARIAATANQPKALLRLRVRPAGAIVLIDGAPVQGDTTRVTVGRHSIAASRTGYRTQTDSFTVRDTIAFSRAVNLAPLPGKLSLSTSIPARLFVNGKAVANPVQNLEVSAGRVLVRFQAQDAKGPWAVDSALTVGPGETVQRKFTLARPTGVASTPTGRLTLTTNVANATITINGKQAATPIRNYVVDAGQVRVHFEVKMPSGSIWSTDSSLTVRAGQDVRKAYVLKPAEPTAAAVAAVSAPASIRRARAPHVPPALAAPILEVPGQSVAVTLATGFAQPNTNVLTTTCLRAVELFWDVLGYDIDVAQVCAATTILYVRGNAPERLINFTRIVRTRDGAIELVGRPSETAEWRNEATGKRLRFRIRGDSIAVTDEAPEIPLTRAATRRAQRSVAARQATEGAVTLRVQRFEGYGAAVKSPRDSLPVAGLTTHPHRVGGCDGLLSFDGEVFRFVPVKGEDTFQFGLADVQSGIVDRERGTLRVRARGGNERLQIKDWEAVFEAILVARMY